MQDPKYFYTLNYNNIMIPKSKKSKSDGCLQQCDKCEYNVLKMVMHLFFGKTGLDKQQQTTWLILKMYLKVNKSMDSEMFLLWFKHTLFYIINSWFEHKFV